MYQDYAGGIRTKGTFSTAPNPVRTVSGLFRTPALAEQAIRAIERFGYNRQAFNVMMNRRIQNFFFTPWDETSRTDHQTWEGARFGALIGALIGAIITVGVTEVFPDLEFPMEGPLVAGLIGVLVGGLTGLLFGAVIGSGISRESGDRPEPEPDDEAFLISVVPATSDEGLRIAAAWEAIGGENIHH